MIDLEGAIISKLIVVIVIVIAFLPVINFLRGK